MKEYKNYIKNILLCSTHCISKRYVVLLFMFFGLAAFSQNTSRRSAYASNTGIFWKPISLSGEIKLEGAYRKHEILYDYLTDTEKSTRLATGLRLNSRSFFWSPNFLILEVEAEYNPELIKQNYIVIPDLAENRTMRKIRFNTSIFRDKFITISTSTNFSKTVSNRENLTNVTTDTKQWGGALSYQNKILPITINYNNNKWTQFETEQDRRTVGTYSTFLVRGSKSFFKTDKHDIEYSYNENTYGVDNMYYHNAFVHNIALRNHVFFDKTRQYSYNSIISYNRQKGSLYYDRFNVNEGLNLKLPAKFTFQTYYRYAYIFQDEHKVLHNNAKAALTHQLYKSLTTEVYSRFTKIDNTVFNNAEKEAGLSVRYTKIIPFKGRLNINNTYSRRNTFQKSQSLPLQIYNEEIILADGQITMLSMPYIIPNSILVKNSNGTIIYQENIDYIIIQRNNFIEIQRFPGGQIADGTGVFIDYIAEQAGNFDYDSNSNSFYSSISVYQGLFEIYYANNYLGYINLSVEDYAILNFYTQNIYGLRSDMKYLSAGAELDNYNSSVSPYKMQRYYLTSQFNFQNRVKFVFGGSYKKYILTDQNIYQDFVDLSLKSTYLIIDLTKLSLDLGYRTQNGQNINLSVLSGRLELTSQLKSLYNTIGIETYKRHYMSHNNNYIGAYFRIVRKF